MEDCMVPAVAAEIFHNFTLLHDDVMDKADIRRGRATVHKAWNENTAILSGDAMLITAYKHLARVAPDVLPRVMNIFCDIHNERYTELDTLL